MESEVWADSARAALPNSIPNIRPRIAAGIIKMVPFTSFRVTWDHNGYCGEAAISGQDRAMRTAVPIAMSWPATTSPG